MLAHPENNPFIFIVVVEVLSIKKKMKSRLRCEVFPNGSFLVPSSLANLGSSENFKG